MKRLISIILAMCSIVLITACGNNDKNAEFKPALDTNTNSSITVVGSYDNFEALEAEFSKFNEIYPNVKLSYMKLDDYNNTIAMALEGDNAPNIFFSYTWMAINEKYDSVFAHAEDLSNSALGLDLDCLRPGLISRTSDGRVLMVPVFSRTYGMLVNNDLFKKEGINVPTTWNELLTVCESFRNKDYVSPMMGYTRNSSSCLMNTVAYPLFAAALANNPEALNLANNLDPAAGEYLRPALEKVEQLTQNNCFNLEECEKISDNYNQVILRFFEGDVPMMVCAGDTVSGTKKREKQSEAFTNSPFDYSFWPLPLTDNGGYFIDSPSVEFSVNKDCDNLDMTNEFMRFLIRNQELNAMASNKRLVTPTKDMSIDPVYSPFGKVPANRTVSPEVIGIKDPLTVQVRIAAYKVGKGEISIDEAVSMYGSFE